MNQEDSIIAQLSKIIKNHIWVWLIFLIGFFGFTLGQQLSLFPQFAVANINTVSSNLTSMTRDQNITAAAGIGFSDSVTIHTQNIHANETVVSLNKDLYVVPYILSDRLNNFYE